MSNAAGRHTRRLEDFARRAWRRFAEERCLSVASGLAFATLIALVPIIVVAVTLLSAFPVFQKASVELQAFLLANMVPESAANVAAYARQLSDDAAGLTAVGLVFLFVTATLVLYTIEQAFNEIWRVPRPTRIARRVLVYGMLLTAAPVLIGISLSLTSWLVSASLGVVRDVPYAVLVLLRIVPVVLTAFAFAMLYVALPSRRVSGRDALAGGFLAAAAFEAMKHGFALYITQFPAYRLVYGAFAAIPIFLIWIHLSWVVVLLGAVAAAVLPEWRERASQVESVPGAQFLDALQVLRVLWAGRPAGQAVSERRLHRAVKLPIHRIEEMLEAMRVAGWVGRGRGGWKLTRDLSGLSVADLYDLFVFRSHARQAVPGSGRELDRHVLDLVERAREKLDVSVEALLEETASGTGGSGGNDPGTRG